MKKITFILFALIAGTTFAQNGSADNASADINAEIVSPISIVNVNPLDFGRIIGNAAGGVVSVEESTDGTRTSTNNDLLAATGNAPTAAKFNILAAQNYTYSVKLVSTNELTGGGGGGGTPMAIAFKTNLEKTLNTGNGSTAIALYVGGDLTVNTDQAEGDYTGEVSVTVTYE